MSKLPYLISTFILIVICINVLLNINGVNGQNVILVAPGHITSCSEGLREGKDNYTFKGILNNTGANWPKSASFQMSVNNADFTSVCSVIFFGCASSTEKCYCASSSGDFYEMVLNVKANKSESEAKIRIQWVDSTISNFVVSNNVSVPKIYDVNAVTTLLTIDGNPVVCPQNISSKSVIKFQCINSPKPCRINISSDNDVIASDDDTIIYTPKTLLPNTSHVLEFSYSVCGEYASKVSCLVTIVSSKTSTLRCNIAGVVLSVIFFIFIVIMMADDIILYIAIMMMYKAGLSFFGFNDSKDCLAVPFWLILLIIFCIIIAFLLIGILVVIIHESRSKDSKHLMSETGHLKDKTSSDGTGREKQEDGNLALQEPMNKNSSEKDELATDEARVETSVDKNHPAKRNSKKKSKGKRKEKANSTIKRELASPNTNNTESGK